MSVKTKNIILVVLVLALFTSPLLIGIEAKYCCAEKWAKELIIQIEPEYRPWFQSIWEPPSWEIVNLLFALQTAIGGGFIGYYLWAKRKTM
jgi:cobalt/nickel transport protein